jgi:OOP family OmpA-OmpF porin
MREYPDAAHFARKGLAASRGEKITPEPISDWNLEQGVMAELSDGRSRLLTIFDLGGREIAPQESAFAQAKFDCWIEAQEEVGSEDTAQECKAAFFDALKALESKIQRPAPAVTEEAPAPALEPVTALPVDNSAPLKAEDAMYLVFFDFDSSTVAGGGDSVLNSVVEEIKARGLKNIKLIGHADTSGSDEYNDKLAMKRAQSVKDALIKRGISTGITLESRGESELLVETSDGVREPANRRVQIMFSE